MIQTKQDFDYEFSTIMRYDEAEIQEYKDIYYNQEDLTLDEVFDIMVNDFVYQDMRWDNFEYGIEYLLTEVDSKADEWKIESQNVGWNNSEIKPEFVSDAQELIDVVVFTEGTVHANVEDDRLVIKFTHHDSPHISQADTFIVSPQ